MWRYETHFAGIDTPLRNALDPNRMTAAERLAEIGEILAAGLLRLRAREQETTAGRPPEPTKARRPHNRSRRKRGAA
jgi:hypothetical protein